jgi:hypothetical protein
MCALSRVANVLCVHVFEAITWPRPEPALDVFLRFSWCYWIHVDPIFWVMYPQGWLFSPSVTVLDAASGLHLKRWVAGAYVSIKPGCHTGAQTGTAG